ncbi:hypothetical protein Sjap_016700 [Stephania japonica]|uniref:C2 domain-containing protein n=1 Tax=Stephania japonica TaxID=461633 RepID=A0AAP0IMQ0_9MAGN
MAGVGSRAIEVQVKSCRDLKAFNFFQKLSVYAVVSVVSETKKKKTVHAHQKTPIDRKGNGNPEWNHKIRFDLKEEDEDNLFLEFQLLCEVIVFGRDKAIGEVRVPIRDLVEEEEEELRGGGGGTVRLMSYQIRGSNGNPNGVLDFSYKVVLINHNHNHDHDHNHDHNHNHNHNRDDEMKNKIVDDDNTNNIVYPKIESIEFHHQASLLYPPLSPPPPPPPPPLGIVHYPTYDDINYLPPLPLPEQIHYQSKNDYFCDCHPSQYTGYVAGYRDVW